MLIITNYVYPRYDVQCSMQYAVYAEISLCKVQIDMLPVNKNCLYLENWNDSDICVKTLRRT